MLAFILTLLVLDIILAIEEFSWKKKILKGEYQRKFGHMSLGIFAATWPWFLNWNQIKILGLLAIIFTLINQYTNVFRYLGAVKRGGYGDIFYATAILTGSLLTDQKLFFALSMLIIALADGLAAIVGKKIRRNKRYKIFGQTKIIAGSVTFWLASIIILGIGLLPNYSPISYPRNVLLLIFLTPILTALENLSVYGMDNFIVPVAVIVALRLGS